MAAEVTRYIHRIAMITYDGTNGQDLADFATNPGGEGTVLFEEDGELVINFGGEQWGATYTMHAGDRLVVSVDPAQVEGYISAFDMAVQWVLSPDE